MKRKLAILFSFFCLYGSLIGQTTMISADMAPTIGDTFLMATDHLPKNIDLETTGQAINWNFTSLQSAYATPVYVNGADKKNEKGNVSSNAILTNYFDGDHLLDIKNGQIDEVGRRIENPFLKGQYLEGFADAPINWLSNFRFGSSDDAQTTFTFSLDEDILRLKGKLDWLTEGMELRIVYSIGISWTADAWGRVRIPFGTFDVVRQHYYEDITGNFEVKNDAGEWDVIDETLTGVRLPDLRNERYIFWSEELPHPVTIIEIDPVSGQAQKVHYKAFEFNSKVLSKKPVQRDVLAYPNPAFDIVRFDLMNLRKGKYTVQIYDILGMRIDEFEVDVNGYTTASINLSYLRKGTYIYRVANENNASIVSKRIVMIKP